MANPFTTNTNNINISKSERLIRQSIFEQLNNQYTKQSCLTEEIENKLNNITSLTELTSFIGSLDLYTLLNLAVSKISSFSPANFNDFIQYIDESTLLLSCLTQKSAEVLDNKPTPSKKFTFPDLSVELSFDFFKTFRNILEDVIKSIILEILKTVFLEVLSFIDCDKVHKCVVPCDPDNNPYKNIFTKIKIKNIDNISGYLNNKISSLDINVSNKDLHLFLEKAVSSLTPDEISCLVKGFLSTKLIQFLTDLFNSLFTDSKTSETQIVNIFSDISEVIDIIPGDISNIPTTPCGNISFETIAFIKLIREGKTEEEAHNIINNTIVESGQRLNNIKTFLTSTPYQVNNLDIPNADIVNVVLSKSIDTMFDSIGSIVSSSMYSLNNILKPIGEVCCAVYWQDDAIKDKFLIPETIRTYITSQISDPLLTNNDFFTNPINLLVNNNNLFEKYNLGNRFNKNSHFTLKYGNNEINIYNKTDVIYKITKSYIIDIKNNLSLSINNTGLQDYISSVSRDNVSVLLTQLNNNLLSRYFLLPIENIANNIYSNTNIFLELDIINNFYFQEYNNTQNIDNNKKLFIELDYFNLKDIKIRIKGKLNV